MTAATWTLASIEPQLVDLAAQEAFEHYGTMHERVTPAALATMRLIVAELHARGAPWPILYSTREGGCQCEWNELFGEVEACANGTLFVWADPAYEEEKPSRDETVWEMKAPASLVAMVVECFLRVAPKCKR